MPIPHSNACYGRCAEGMEREARRRSLDRRLRPQERTKPTSVGYAAGRAGARGAGRTRKVSVRIRAA
jgi:hypothetical protein